MAIWTPPNRHKWAWSGVGWLARVPSYYYGYIINSRSFVQPERSLAAAWCDNDSLLLHHLSLLLFFLPPLSAALLLACSFLYYSPAWGLTVIMNFYLTTNEYTKDYQVAFGFLPTFHDTKQITILFICSYYPAFQISMKDKSSSCMRGAFLLSWKDDIYRPLLLPTPPFLCGGG